MMCLRKGNATFSRYTVRALLIAIALLAVVLSILCPPLADVVKSRRVVNAVEQSCGEAYFDFQHDDSHTELSGGGWRNRENFKIKDAIGREFFGNVALVSVGKQANGNTLRQISQLNSLRELIIEGANLTDQDMSCLAELRSVKKLMLVDLAISAKGLAFIRSMRELKELIIIHVPVGDDGVNYLMGLPKLEIMHLDRDGMSPGAIQTLRAAYPKTNFILDP
jgi:hypothetical protein